jgi:hypothetical protein
MDIAELTMATTLFLMTRVLRYWLADGFPVG